MEREFFWFFFLLCWYERRGAVSRAIPRRNDKERGKKESLLFLYVYVKLFHTCATHCGPSNSMLTTFQHKLIGLICSSLNFSQQNHIGDTPRHRHPTSPDCSLSKLHLTVLYPRTRRHKINSPPSAIQDISTPISTLPRYPITKAWDHMQMNRDGYLASAAAFYWLNIYNRWEEHEKSNMSQRN